MKHPAIILIGILLSCRAFATDSVVRFNEVMYNPPAGEHLEWVEISNLLSLDMDLSKWKVTGGIDFEFPEGAIIPADGFLVVAKSPAAFAAQTGITNALGPFSGQLANGGERIRLRNNSKRLMDELDYGDRGDWAPGPDGSGFTLAKIKRTRRSEPAENWWVSDQPNGTPGQNNFRPPTTPSTQVLINLDTEWHYDESGIDQGIGWRAIGFDDSAWSVGSALFATGAPPAAVPLSVTNQLMQWYRADSLNGFNDGDPVPTWNDLALGDGIPQNLNALGDPQYFTNVANGRAVVRFDGGADEHRSVISPFIGPSDGFVYVLVVRANAPPDSGTLTDEDGDYLLDRFPFINPNPLASLKAVNGRYGFQIRYDGGTGLGGALSTTPMSQSSFQIVALRRNRTSNLFEVWVNGFREGTTADLGALLTPQPPNLGHHGTAPTSGFNGDIAELLLYGDQLSTPDLQSVASYLAGQYDVPLGGIGGEPVRTYISSNAPTVYFRTDFEFCGDPSRTTLTLERWMGDGAVFYLNGQEVERVNMPTGAITFATAALAPATNTAAQQVTLSSEFLISGRNLLAVELHQASGSDNALFGANLRATTPIPIPGSLPAMAINEIAAATGGVFWVELVNRCDRPQGINGLELSIAGDPGRTFTITNTALAVGDFLVLGEAELGFSGTDEEPVFLFRPGATNLLDAQLVKNRLRGRAPSGDRAWLYPDSPTPGGTNLFTFRNDIVINEIMYHQRPQQDPFVESPEEWIELYNRGTGTVDLAGWELDDAIRYRFPSGTTLNADDYLIVPWDLPAFVALYPGLAGKVVGPYAGSLSGSGEQILLRDPLGNPADRVHYHQGGRWPKSADGYGSSLELRDADADNATAEAWAPSDESGQTTWRTYTNRAVATASQLGPDGQWHEFIMGLNVAGEVLIDDVSVVEDPDGAATPFIQNGDFETDAVGSIPDKWRIIGNHRHSEVIIDPSDGGNKVLRFVSTGTTEHMHNHAETTFAGGEQVVNGQVYEVTFRARWVRQSEQLNTRLYFNRLAKTFRLDTPTLTGTPGAPNSTRTPNAGPTHEGVMHSPPVPAVGEAVQIRAQVTDPDTVTAVTTWYAVNEGPWNSMPMTGYADGQYLAELPGQAAADIVQFYIESQDSLGAVARFPAEGPDSRALYKVDDGMAAVNGRHNFRIVMLPSEGTWMRQDINVMSNDRIPCTVIYEERDIYYNAGVRHKGSERHRTPDIEVGFNVRFPADQLFQGIHPSVAIDRTQGVGAGQREMLINIVMNHFGGEISRYSDFIKVLAPVDANTSSAEMQLARYGAIYLDDQFDSGGDGQTYEYELIYFPTTTDGGLEGNKRPNPDGVLGTPLRDMGPDKEQYRWVHLTKINRDEDDYAPYMAYLAKMALPNPAFNQQIGDYIDINQWLRAMAVNVASGCGDSFGQNSQHNARFFVRPTDQRVLFLPHDMDAFHSTTRPLANNTYLNKLLADAGHTRMYHTYMYSILTTSYNSTYIQPWTDQLSNLSPEQNFETFRTFINNRHNFLMGQLNGNVAPQYPFAVTTADGSTSNSTVQIQGNAWIDVEKVFLDGFSDPLELTWTSSGAGVSRTYSWTATVPLEPGTNLLTFTAYDPRGNLVSSDSVTITSTIPDRPIRDHLRITELMYDPIGGSAYEFIELHNTGTNTLALTNVFFNAGITFAFSNQTLAAGEYLVLAKDPIAFATRYGSNGFAGVYGGSLANGGETIELLGEYNFPLIRFAYRDNRGWPLAADGPGHSLVPVASAIADQPLGSLYYGSHWRPSTFFHGSPGGEDPAPPDRVTINEIVAHTDFSDIAFPGYDSNDRIELFNSATSSLTFSDYYLTDSKDDLRKWRIPSNRVVAGRSWIIFNEVTDFHSPISNGFGLDKARETVLLSYLPSNGTDRVVDAVRFEGQENGASLGRYPDGSNAWYTLIPTSNTQNALPALHLVLNEIMYHPPDAPTNNVLDEFVEIYNPTDQPVDLWNTVGTWRVDGGVRFDFPPNTTLSPSNGLVVVSFSPTNAPLLNAFLATYGLSNGAITILGPYSGALDNRGERIALERPQAADRMGDNDSWVIIDEAIYFHRTPWDGTADGTGLSLQRKFTRWDGNLAENWYVSQTVTPGDQTPAYGPPNIPECWFPETHPDWTNNFEALALQDFDLDGLATWEEFVAGTGPTNALDVPRLSIAATGSVVTVGFQTHDTGPVYNGLERFYTLDAATNLTPSVFQPIPGITDLQGDDGFWEFVLPATTNRHGYFRLRLQLR